MFHQVGRQGRQALVMTIRGALFDRRVLAFDDANLAQTFPEGIHQRQRLPRPLVEKSDYGK